MVVANLYIDKDSSSTASYLYRLFDCGKSSIIQWLVLISLLVFFVPRAVGEEELVCQKGVSGFPGATFPRGDILLKEGDTLEVYCRLDMRKTVYNATFIKFRFTKANISEALMKTTVINETTALLQVERMNASSPHLSCEIAPPGLRRVQVCQNEIDVGYPPRPVESFRCVAQDWQSLNCTWTKPYNPIPTNYALQILQKAKSFTLIHICPNVTATPTSCVWDGRTEPFYRSNLNPLILRINGTNILDPNGTTWDIYIDHWSIVVPEAPTDLRTHLSSPDVVTVAWAFKSFKDFVPGLVHQVTVCIQNFTVPCNVTKLQSYKGSGHMELNIPLDYAYVNYTVEIRMRSPKAKDEPSFWSKPSVIIVPSEAKNPNAPPKVNIGSYESVSVSDKKRDIYVYWEEVAPLLRNGPGFHYILTLQEDEELKPEIEPMEITRSYAKFTGLWLNRSYRFQIVSANDVGNSSSSALVYVPKIPKAPHPPTAVSKFDFTNGSFVVSWNPVAAPVQIVSYTVFRCLSKRARPYQCQGLVKWDIVSSREHSKVYDYLPHDNITYQFAVAANAEGMSSGMAWATCTLIHGRVPGKLTKVAKSEGEKEIYIEWQLDCSYKPGVIDGYKISYCRVAGRQNKSDHCIDDVNQQAVSGASITSYYLRKLQPCTTYKISVSIISSNGESQKSDPIFATTKPSAPSKPPKATVVSVTNTSATILISPQPPLNGVVKEYRIKYKSSETGDTVEKSYPVFQHSQRTSSIGDEKTTDSCVDGGALVNQTEEIKNLLSSSNYTFTVAACTSKCSEDSTLVSFKTDVGYTNVDTFPNINMDGDHMLVEWPVPPHIRGPIAEFQILLKQSGKMDDIASVPYESESNATRYHHKMKFSCETNTNLTAQVRTVTVIETTGETLYSKWGPPGNYNCGGGASWIVWVGVAIGVIIIVGVIGFISTKAYTHLKEMKEVNVKLPPGMAVQDLNGFSHSHPKRRRDSEGDTQSFGKDNLPYQLQMTTTHHSDDSKDFASLTESCLQQESAAGFVHHREMSFDNKVYSEELEGNIPLTKLVDTSGHGTQSLCTVGSSQIPNVENESLLNEKRLSPSSPTNPLLGDSLTTDEEEPTLPLQDVEMYSNVQNIFDGLGLEEDSRSENGSPTPFSSSPYPPGSAEDSPSSRRDPDILPGAPGGGPTINLSNNSVFPPNPGNGVGGLNLPPPQTAPGSSYVKWTQMLPDQFINGDGPLGGIDHGHKTPYCQVGILLDSN